MSPLVAGLLGGLAGNYFSDDKNKNLLSMFGKQAQANPHTMIDPQAMIGGQPHVGNQPQMMQQPQPQQQGGGFLGGLKNAWNDEESRARMTIALNSLRHKPDANIAQSMENKIKMLQGKGKANKTAEYLSKTNPKLAEMLRQGIIDSKTAVSMLGSNKPSALAEKMALWQKDPEAFKKMRDAGVVGGGGVNINMNDESDFEFQKYAMKSAQGHIDAGVGAQNAMAKVTTLMELGKNETLNSVPNLARGFIPTGFSAAADAYKSQMVGVAKGQRTAGEGPMSDKDIELLIQAAGPISSDIKARNIAQQALVDNSKRAIERANIGRAFMSQQIDLPTYHKQMSMLGDQPLLSDDMRGYIQALGKAPSYNSLPQEAKGQVTEEQWNAMPFADKMLFKGGK